MDHRELLKIYFKHKPKMDLLRIMVVVSAAWQYHHNQDSGLLLPLIMFIGLVSITWFLETLIRRNLKL